MPQPYSMDLRRRVIAACEAGDESQAEVAARFSVSRTTVVMWLRLQRETGELRPRKGKTGPPSTVTTKHLAVLRKIIARRPDLTYLELTERWNRAIGLDRHRSVTVRAVKALGYTLKKKPSSPRNAKPQRSKKREPGTASSKPTLTVDV